MSLARTGRLITSIGLGLLAAVYVRSLAFTPVERLQGPAQKIYYLHVPAAIWAETAMVLVGLAGSMLVTLLLSFGVFTRLYVGFVMQRYALALGQEQREQRSAHA